MFHVLPGEDDLDVSETGFSRSHLSQYCFSKSDHLTKRFLLFCAVSLSPKLVTNSVALLTLSTVH